MDANEAWPAAEAADRIAALESVGLEGVERWIPVAARVAGMPAFCGELRPTGFASGPLRRALPGRTGEVRQRGK